MSSKNLFHRIFETLVEARSRQARRYVDAYLKERGIERPHDEDAVNRR